RRQTLYPLSYAGNGCNATTVLRCLPKRHRVQSEIDCTRFVGLGSGSTERLPSTGSEGSGALHVLASGNVFPVPELVGVPLGPARLLPAVLARVRDQPVVLLAASGLGSPAEVQCQAPAVVRGAGTSGEARFAGGDGDLRLQRAVGIGDGEVLSGVLLERRVHLREGDRGIGAQ